MKEMRARMIIVVALVAGAMPLLAHAREPAPSDEDVRQILIRKSIESYAGSCPCPYSTARNGSRCGKRSAYSRPGGASPLCYSEDVSAEMVARYRTGRGSAAAR